MNEIHIQIGQILRNKRLKKNITLEKVSEKTKISLQNLKNIEDGRISLLPGEFYQKSFLKTYANTLRISDTQLLSLFYKSLNQPNLIVKNNNENSLKKNQLTLIKDKIPAMPLIVFASIGLITFFVINLFLTSEKVEKLADIKPKSNMEYSPIKNNIIDEIKELKKNTPIKQTNLNLDDANYNSPGNDVFLKQIIAKEDVWIEIKDLNENILISTVLKKDETLGLPSDSEEIIISTSNAGALYLKSGDISSPTLGSFGDTIDSVNLSSLITKH